MLTEILRFEIRNNLRSPVFWLAGAIFFLLVFGAITTDAVQIGGAIGRVYRNAPFVITQLLAQMSVVAVFASTAFVAGAVVRDYEYRTHEIMFSTRITPASFFFGRFLGGFASAVLIVVPVALAIVIGSWMPWLDPARVGPFMPSAYLSTFAILVIPNLFLMSAVFFGVATMTRSMMWTYVCLAAFLVGFSIASNLLGDLENEWLGAMSGPFGLGALGLDTRYWTIAEKNTRILELTAPLLANRALWLGIGTAVLLFAFGRFELVASPAARRRKSVSKKSEAPATLAAEPAQIGPAGTLRFDNKTHLVQLLHSARHEIRGIVFSAPFFAILLFGIVNLVGGAANVDQIFGAPVHPRTYLLFQVIQGSFLLFLIIILTFYSGESVFRERQLGMADILDAMPTPVWVAWGSKTLALAVVVILLLTTASLAAIGTQLFQGFTDIEPGLYIRGVLGVVGLPFLLVAILAVFLQVIANNKFIGYLLMVLYLLAQPILVALDYTHNIYLFAGSPPTPYSEMNGYGHFLEPYLWFTAYWTFGAILLLVAVQLLWPRGRDTDWKSRLRLARLRWTLPTRAVAALAGAAFVATGAWIYYNTYVLNEHVSPDEFRDRQARFETAYKQFENLPQPKITAIRSQVEIFPDERALKISGTYELENKTGAPLSEVHVLVPPIMAIRSIDLPGGAVASSDEQLGYFIYRLSEPMAAGAKSALSFELAWEARGFRNGGFNNRVVGNGSFVHSNLHFPHIGYTSYGELADPNERRKRGLEPIQRLPALEDESARQFHALGSEADWVHFETVVSTSPDQTALAPGYLKEEWTEAGRRYFRYEMDAPILAYHAYLSARYEVRKDRWNDVEISVYHHPDHDYNVDKMIEASKAGLDYFSDNFGPYQHRQFRIIEFPRYARFAEAFPNSIPFSESIGFIAKLDDPDEIDYVTYVTAHELGHQWWAHQVIGASVQGTTMITETMAQYSALMVMEKMYGPERMRRFLRYELDAYLRGRGGELIEELPLFRVEVQPYIHYRKGSLAMYALKDYIGEDALNQAISRYVAETRFREPPYTTTLEWLDFVRAAVPADRQSIIEDLFETITIYDNRATAASIEALDDGRYALRVDVETHKYRADGQGNEKEIDFDDWVDIAAFGERGENDPPDGKWLAMEKRRITGSGSTIELIVDEKPVRAGIDPLNKLVDRNPEDNLQSVRDAG